MNYNQLTCGQNAGNTGLQNCSENFGMWDSIILCPDDFQIDTLTDALLLSAWVEAVNFAKSERIYPLPQIFQTEPDQEDPVYEEGQNGQKEFRREGKDRAKLTLVNISQYNYTQLRKHNGRKNIACYIVTTDGYILGHSLDDTKFLPLDLSQFRVEKKSIPTSDASSRGMIYVEFADATQWNDYGVWVKPTDWSPNYDILGIKDVQLVAGAITGTTFVVTVKGASDNVALTGLAAGDFVLTKTGTPVTISSISEATDGVYTLNYTTQTGTLVANLRNQPDMVTPGFESIGSCTATIS